MFADDDFYASLGSSLEGFENTDASCRPFFPGERPACSDSARVFPRTESGQAASSRRSSSSCSGRIVELYEDDELAEGEGAPDAADGAFRETGPLAGLSEKIRKARRSKTKERAGRKFTSQYGGESSPDASSGPRAAVYKAEMGSQHRRAARLQDAKAQPSGAARSASTEKPSGLTRLASSKALVALCGVAACLLFCCTFLYTPVQQYYQELRERDRLELEYAAVQGRNDSLEASVAYLSTDEGVEDQAREEFGWVKDGERAVSVSGIEVEKDSDFTANVLSSDIKPPDTWYSGVLDPLFGVE